MNQPLGHIFLAVDMNVNSFKTIDLAVDEILSNISQVLLSSLSEFGFAALCLPGGNTALPILKRLSDVVLPWEKVYVFLTDERLVPIGDKRRNDGNLKKYFLDVVNPSPIYIEAPSNYSDLEIIKAHYKNLFLEKKIPICMLIGMGVDGHIASLFSESDMSRKGVYCFTTDPNGVNRVSLTLDFIVNAANIFLLFFGAEKYEQLQQSIESNPSTAIGNLYQRCGEKVFVAYCIE